MRVKFKPLNEQSILITGASSGIGLLTAQTAATYGARVILIARNEEALKLKTDEINAKGGKATYAVADVADADAFRAAAEKGISAFGGQVDTWINDAGVGMFGKVTETDIADDRRLFETNFWGLVNGSRLAVEYLRGGGGKLINVGSVVSDASIPPQTMYSASKHAVLGFTDGLRIEIQHDDLPISVTLIKPAAIDTPFARHARNYMDVEPSLPDPVYAPELVASAILYAATHEKRELYIGSGGRAMAAFNVGLPSLMDRVFGSNYMWSRNRTDRPAKNTQGSLHESLDGGDTHGGVDRDRSIHHVSLYNSAAQHPLVTGTIITAALAAAAAFIAIDHTPESSYERWRNSAFKYGRQAGATARRYGRQAQSYWR